MNQQPLVSVIIDNYNYGRFLGTAIDSALNQTYRNVEVIVVDDGSTDNSRDIITGYEGQVIPVFKQNGGQASAFNAGFEVSQGDLICFLDADDIMLPTRVETAVQILNQHPNAGWSYHQLGLMDEAGNPFETNHLDVTIDQVYEFDLRQEMQQGTLRQLALPLPGIVGLTFRRSHLEQILPMPEADGISLSDSYVQLVSCYVSPGVAFPLQLEWQRIHGSNGFTQNGDRIKVSARIHLMTAHWMRINFPGIGLYANNLLSAGIARYLRARTIEAKSWELLQKYFSGIPPSQQLKIALRSLYHAARKPVF
jgi:glycosyltransferase involved in cell wall biosynthesis